MAAISTVHWRRVGMAGFWCGGLLLFAIGLLAGEYLLLERNQVNAKWQHDDMERKMHQAQKDSMPTKGSAQEPFEIDENGVPNTDIVVTWVNFSHAAYLRQWTAAPGLDVDWPTPEAYPVGVDLSDSFVELKYQMRSLEKHGLLARIRHVHIVHSDLHPPPTYFQTDHPQLKLVPHSKMFGADRASCLPTFNRNAIDSQLHRIPELAKYFLRLDDDFLLMSPFEKSEFFKDGKIVVHGGSNMDTGKLQGPACNNSQNDGYRGSMLVSNCLLEDRFPGRSRRYYDHYPVMSLRPAIEEMEALWPEWFNNSAHSRWGHPGNRGGVVTWDNSFYWALLTLNYLEHTGRAVFSGHGPGEKERYGELHTNAHGWCPRPCDGYKHDATNATVDKVQRWLLKAEASYRWINVQGPGFDDSYRHRHNYKQREYSPKIERVARAWFDKVFPEKSSMEIGGSTLVMATEVP